MTPAHETEILALVEAVMVELVEVREALEARKTTLNLLIEAFEKVNADVEILMKDRAGKIGKTVLLDFVNRSAHQTEYNNGVK